MTIGLARRLIQAGAVLALYFLTLQGAAAHGIADPLESVPTQPAVGAPVEQLTGAIHQLVIDDRVAGAVITTYSLTTDDGRVVGLKGAERQGLKSGDRVQATGQRNGKALFVSGVKVLPGAGRDAGRGAGPPASVEGQLALLHADDFDAGRSEFLFELHEPGGSITQLRFPRVPEALQRGMHVVVSGAAAADGNGIVPDTVTILALPTEPQPKALLKAATINNVLVILMTFTDSPPIPFSQAQVQSVFAGGPGSASVTEYFKEASYGQQLLAPTITGWLPTNAATPAGCNWSQMATLGRNAAIGGGYNPVAYRNLVYVFPAVAACGWIGLGYVGASGVWINGRNATSVYGHELGHNFGLLHAASLRCSGGPIGGACSASEYGDPFDIMGNQSAMHFNAAQKLDLGWIPAGSVMTHSAGTSTYILSAIESAGGTTYAVKIPAFSNRTYWLEYRQPVGFDSALASYPNNGAQIRVASPFETLCSGCDSWSDDTELLDMTPGTSTFTDAALVVGRSFTDTTYGISINVVSATSTGLAVQVTAPGGVAAATTTTLASSLNPSTAGSAVTFTASVTGVSPTGSVSLTDNGAAIAGCSAVALSGSGNTRTAGCSTSAMVPGTHEIVATYGGDAGNLSSTSAPHAQVVNQASSTNVALASVGVTASASTTHSSRFPVSALINGDRTGAGWSAGNAGWADGTPNAWPDWVEIDFHAQKSIDRVIIYSVQDNYTAPVEPTNVMVFSLYGVRDFTVQGWDGSQWVTLGAVADNNLVKRAVFFSPFTTDRIRVNITNALDTWSRITEVEAWGTPAIAQTRTASNTILSASPNPVLSGSSVAFTATVTGNAPNGSITFTENGNPIPACGSVALVANGSSSVATCTTTILSVGSHRVVASYGGDSANAPSISPGTAVTVNQGPSANVALSSAGAIAVASSTHSARFPVSAIINGDRTGMGWSAGNAGWADGTANAWPDWVQITFNGRQSIDRVVVYSVQDKYTAPLEPSDDLTFSLYGIRDYVIQGWDGSSWVTLSAVSGNTLVKRSVNFNTFVTDGVRVLITNALDTWSRLTEVEVWSP